jgi:hypothetical protein
LVRAGVVVLGPEHVHRGLRGGHVRERAVRLWKRFTLPVVVGDRGLVRMVSMPFLRQIRSNNASAARGLPNLPVNCLPLSDNTCCGQPNARSACTNAVHTARAVALGTTLAMTQYREWSSSPVTTFSSRPSVRKQEPTMSS